ncbi:MAG TPA: FtsX-like permease family protein [Vicinamibacterales bacterium]
MNLNKLSIQSAQYFWRTNIAVALGVAAAVAVLAGALVVGDSVRRSLRDLALGRLGRTEHAISSQGFFRESAIDFVRSPDGYRAAAAAPLIVADGFVTLESSGRRAGNVFVYGVDERFWTFHGLPPTDGVFVSPALAAEVGAKEGDVLLTRLQKPSAVPIESLFGRKEDVGRTVRLTLDGVLPRDRLGEFALQPQQTDVRAVFAPLRRVQRDLAVPGQVNTILVAGLGTAPKLPLPLEDLGVRITASPPGTIIVEHASGVLSDALVKAIPTVNGVNVRVFSYLANTIRKGDRRVPYSLITAAGPIDPMGRVAVREVADVDLPPELTPGGIALNEWAARELSAAVGDKIDVEYYRWDATTGLTTHTETFTLERILPVAGFASDRRLVPEYPGMTEAKSLGDWDPPFPIDLARVRPVDEEYWTKYRTTPKAFIPYERGAALWGTRYGRATSVRLITGGMPIEEKAKEIASGIYAQLPPAAAGVSIAPVRAAALQAAQGATDFGEYFTYFSFFLVVSALLLAVLFFKLGVEQRLRQIGILRATGYTMATVRRLLIGEALVLAAAGGAIGIAGAIAYGQLIVYGLRTWWVGAVGTTMIDLHVRPGTLAAGAAGGVIAAVLCVLVSLRAVARLSPRHLLTAQSIDAPSAIDSRRARRSRLVSVLFAAIAVGSLILAFVRPAAQTGAFFGAGAAMLVSVLSALSAWLRARGARPIAGHGPLALTRLGFRSAAFRPARSILSAALIASAAFIIVSVDAFRREGRALTTDPKSGTGGYVLYAESEIPLLNNPNDASGREAMMIQAPELAAAHFTRFRVRAGDDASCLNLYRPTNPTIVAPEDGFIESNRFTFAASVAESDAEHANPWLLLRRQFPDGTVPVVADATSLQYVLHKSVGDTMSIDTGAVDPLVIRFVGALSDSVLQGELVMAPDRFAQLFPQLQGYRLLLVDGPAQTLDDARALAGIVERELQPFGVDATVTSERLAAFHRVENTYLSTFQSLGGLGLLLGTIGLATVMFRNVLERRRELALLRAVGYDARGVTTMILAEAAFLLGTGLVAGAGSAAVAIAPAWLGRGGAFPDVGLLLLLLAVIAAGLVSSIIATRAALSGTVIEGLRAE